MKLTRASGTICCSRPMPRPSRRRHVFFKLYSDLAAQNGDCTDLAYTPVRHEGRGGYQVDGYALEAERGDLFSRSRTFDRAASWRP